MNAFEIHPNSYLIMEEGKVSEITPNLPTKYRLDQVEDMGEALIIPGFVDLHLHAPQWQNVGVGYSEELLTWLNKYTFPLESTFSDVEVAKAQYQEVINALWEVGTTRSCIMATRHMEATDLLMTLFRQSGLGAYIGKVNMDRNAEKPLVEDTESSIKETKMLIEKYKAEHNLVNYMITPRFVPSTTSRLMQTLGELAEVHDLPVQSHLDENRSEVNWVRSLHPESLSYAEVYEKYGLLRTGRTIMAHCIYCTEEEVALLKRKDVYLAHCAHSNFNLSSGIMPLRQYLKAGLKVGLGSDISGGHTLDMRENIVGTLQASKMHWLSQPEDEALRFCEAFYLATKGGGSFFGKVGSLEEGYEGDVLVVDDLEGKGESNYSIEERLEQFIYAGSKDQIQKRYVRGIEIKKPF